MNRRGFFSSLAAIAATATLDPERLLWRPGKKKIFIPRAPEVVCLPNNSLIGEVKMFRQGDQWNMAVCVGNQASRVQWAILAC